MTVGRQPCACDFACDTLMKARSTPGLAHSHAASITASLTCCCQPMGATARAARPHASPRVTLNATCRVNPQGAAASATSSAKRFLCDAGSLAFLAGQVGSCGCGGAGAGCARGGAGGSVLGLASSWSLHHVPHGMFGGLSPVMKFGQ